MPLAAGDLVDADAREVAQPTAPPSLPHGLVSSGGWGAITVPFCVESELSGVRQQVLTSTFAFSIRKRSLGTDGTVLDSHASSSRSTLLTPCYVYTPGIEQVGPRSYLWYKRTVTIPPGCGKRNF